MPDAGGERERPPNGNGHAGDDRIDSDSFSELRSLIVGPERRELLALQAQQFADLTAVVAAHGRAQNLESAQHTAAQDQGREQLRRFLTQGRGYQPTTVQMFH